MIMYLVYHRLYTTPVFIKKMIMEELIFQKVQKGDMIFTLEKDRRSGYPIFDQARVKSFKSWRK